jgi:sulfatase modifying factor 1
MSFQVLGRVAGGAIDLLRHDERSQHRSPAESHVINVSMILMRLRFLLAGWVLVANCAGPSVRQGDIWANPKDGLRYVYVPPGTFRMGCSPGDTHCVEDERPTHNVRISKGFWMGQTPVTVAAYRKAASVNGVSMPELDKGWDDDAVPMTSVSWADSRGYCAWAGLRLPTEAEWEYAARAGITGVRYGELNEIAWHIGNSGGHPRPVARKRANAFLLYDMLGNVSQWTADWYGEKYYSQGAELDPQGPTTGTDRVLRGGRWAGDSATIRASNRDGKQPTDYHNNYTGFRCAGARVP